MASVIIDTAPKNVFKLLRRGSWNRAELGSPRSPTVPSPNYGPTRRCANHDSRSVSGLANGAGKEGSLAQRLIPLYSSVADPCYSGPISNLAAGRRGEMREIRCRKDTGYPCLLYVNLRRSVLSEKLQRATSSFTATCLSNFRLVSICPKFLCCRILMAHHPILITLLRLKPPPTPLPLF